MTTSRSAVFLVTLAFLWTCFGDADAQKVGMSSTSIEQHVLSLNFTNNGQHLAATVGQRIEITLGTVGPKQYGTPQVSSPAIRLESVALAVPPNPGGPTYVYIFETTAEGEAQVKIPIINSENPDWTKRLTFAVTIHVGSAGHPLALHASMTPDQANTAPWKNAWTNLLNDVRQTFTPSPVSKWNSWWPTRAHPMTRLRCIWGMQREKCWRLYQTPYRSPTAVTFCSFFPTAVCQFRPDRFTASG